jgi:iron complex transport system ATP-binding protein
VSELPHIALQTTNLEVGYKKGNQNIVLFEPLSLTLARGELVCFMGANGIGKTTLIKILAGIQVPISGTVTTSYSTAIVLTDKISGSLMTVRDLVTYGRYPHLNWWLNLNEQDHVIIESAIRKVHLESIADKQLSQLSDGQLQMAMIAKALAQDANILLLDEPTAHLDLNNRVAIMNLLRSLAREHGKTILISTHELDLALQTADKIWLATQNKKIVAGIPEDLVLDGTFDSVFQLKGFDLKSGKISHTPYRKTKIQLYGSGSEFLWTKNALERCGYEMAVNQKIKVTVKVENNKPIYEVSNTLEKFRSLKDLLDYLN